MGDCQKPKNIKKSASKTKCDIFEFAQVIGQCHKIVSVK